MIQVQSSAKLGGTASDMTVARVAHGLMRMTWVPTPVPDETCFESIKAGIDALPDGTKALLNSSEFYGNDLTPTANLEMLARFFETYPEYADRVFLCVKGGTTLIEHKYDASYENLKRSVQNINTVLRGTKSLDLFECARVDPNYAIEDTVRILAGFIEEGMFNHLGMSECRAETVRRAHPVYPVSLVEIEVSAWSYEKETKEVIATCKELGISITAYSPLGRGALSGKITKPEDIEPGDGRRHFSRFREENWKHNLVPADTLKRIAERKGCTFAQLNIAWVCSRGDHVIPLPGSSHRDRTLENLKAGDIILSSDEVKEIDDIVETFEVKGGRYRDNMPLLWG